MKNLLTLTVIALVLMGCDYGTNLTLDLSPTQATAPIGSAVTLKSTSNGEGTYSWTVVGVPAGSSVVVGKSLGAGTSASLVPDVVGDYGVSLVMVNPKVTRTAASTITAVSNPYLGSWTNSGATFTDFAFGFGNVFTAKRAGIPYSGTWAMRGSTMTATAGGTDFAFTYSGGLVYSATTYTPAP